MNLRIIIFALVWVLFCSAGVVQAKVYRCQDASGAIAFQDSPCGESRAATFIPRLEVDQLASGKSFLWRAKSAKGQLYLLGSIHFGRADLYPLPRVMTSAFRESDTLVVEANIVDVDPLQMAQWVSAKGVYSDGGSLKQNLSADTWRRLSAAAQRLGTSADLLNGQKPWLASMTITALALNRMGLAENYGVDRHFINLARDKKKLVELEGILWQLSLFDQFSEAEQVLMLEQTLQELELGPEYFDKMIEYWRRGDEEGIQSLFDDGVAKTQASERFHKLVMTDRNVSMTEKLDKLAQQGGTLFVVVGAGHLVGSEGVVRLLEQRGYEIEQL